MPRRHAAVDLPIGLDRALSQLATAWSLPRSETARRLMLVGFACLVAGQGVTVSAPGGDIVMVLPAGVGSDLLRSLAQLSPALGQAL
jgi:hypothetical protein